MNSSIESRQTHRPRPCNRLRMAGAALLAMLVAGGIMLGLGMSPSRASAQVAEDQLGATVEVNEQAITQMLAQLTESAPAHERLVRLSEFLGSRHPSQPGNARADEMVRRYFESLAAQDQTPDEQDALEADRARLADLDERIAAAVRTSHFPGPDLSAEEFASRAAEAQQQVNELSIEAAVLAHHIARTQADNWRSGRVSFPLAIFHPGQATLSGPTGSASMDQLAPNLVDPGNLPEEGFEGELLFVGGASPRELSEVDLAGKAVLMTFNSANRWVNAMELGARVVLILEPEGDPGASFSDAEQKSNLSPVTAPRFLVTREAIDAALGEDWLDGGEPASIRIDATPGRWLPRELNAHWLFIPGDAVPASAGSDDARFSRDPARQIVHIQTHLDANSVAPARSPGATGLANLIAIIDLIEGFRQAPPQRPVLVSIVNGHSQGLAGETALAYAAFGDPAAFIREVNWLERHQVRELFTSGIFSQPPTNARITELVDGRPPLVAGEAASYDGPIVDLLRGRRNEIQEERLAMALLEDLARSENDQAELDRIAAQRAVLDVEFEEIRALMNLFRRFGERVQFESLAPTQQDRMRSYFDRIARESEGRAEDAWMARQRLIQNARLREALLPVTSMDLADDDAVRAAIEAGGGGRPAAMAIRYAPLETVLSLNLDLSFGNNQVGLFPYGGLAPRAPEADSLGPIQRFALQRSQRLAAHALTVAADIATAAPEHHNRLADTLRNVGGTPMDAYLGSPAAFGSLPVHQYAQPGLTLTTVHDGRPRAYTPHDQVERIDAVRLAELLDFTTRFVPALIEGEGLTRSYLGSIGRANRRTQVAEAGIRLKDQFSVTLPKTPLVGALRLPWKAIFASATADRPGVMKGEVRPYPVFLSDRRGVVYVRGMMYARASMLTYKYDEDYRELQAAMDSGEQETKFSSLLNFAQGDNFIDTRSVAFNSRKIDLYGMTEPLTLEPVSTLQVLNAHTESTSRQFAVAGVSAASRLLPVSRDGSAALILEREALFKIRPGRNLVLNADPERPEGRGFRILRERLPNLVGVSAHDMAVLSDHRLDNLSSKGVRNTTAQAFSDSAAERLDQIRSDESGSFPIEVKDAGDLAVAEEARGYAYWSYSRSLETINDLIRAVVIFLALVIPFCFFFMKLVSPYDDVGKQMSLFGAIFVITALALLLLHPAFKVAETPLMPLLAFVMLGMAVFVSSILVGRFNASMNQAIEEAHQSESVDSSQSRTTGAAFLVGVNNMKRRRIRTSLTCATIVLVTFTMLSVISVSDDTEPARVRVGVTPPYAGFLVSQPGLARIDGQRVNRLRAHFNREALVVARMWAERKDEFDGTIPFEVRLRSENDQAQASGSVLQANILFGLETSEEGLLGEMPLVSGGRWFSADDAEEAVLSVRAASVLGLTPENYRGRRVTVLGRDLEIVGLLDDAEVEAMQDLNEVPFLPLLSEPRQTAAASSAAAASDAAGSAELASDLGAGVLTPGTRMARAVDVIFMPIELTRQTGFATYRTLSVSYDTPDRVTGEMPTPQEASTRAWRAANELIQWQYMRLGLGLTSQVSLGENRRPLEGGQYAIASSQGTQVGGVVRVAIPIILAATIIFNTMLGSVMERRREVGIYNAIGLNPGHVMMFFLAESLVFGVVGSVAGYLIGQAMSLVVTQFIDLNLNYSSTSVMLVIFLTIATVLLSTVYPAVMAARAAVPSGQRRWSLPQPTGDEIHIDFPFSYDAQRVLGICAYLRDYMYLHSEASTGSFLATLGPVGRITKPGFHPGASRIPGASAGSADDLGPAGQQPGSSPPATGEGPSTPAAGSSSDLTAASATADREKDDGVVYAMVFNIAPAPFDLGVNQTMEVYAYFNTHVRAHMLSVHLTRTSGERGNWVTVNQPFLEALRKRLLGWRSQKDEIHQTFFERGKALFADAPELPVHAEQQEAG